MALCWCQPVASEGVTLMSGQLTQPHSGGQGAAENSAEEFPINSFPTFPTHQERLTEGEVGRRKEMNLNSSRSERFV